MEYNCYNETGLDIYYIDNKVIIHTNKYLINIKNNDVS